MANQIPDADVNKLSVRGGLIIGVITIVLFLVFHFIDPVLQFTSYWVSILSLVIVIALLVIYSLDTRKKIGGYWSFGQAYLSLLIMAVCMVVLSTLFNFVIFKLEPDLPAKINSAMLDKLSTTLSNMGLEQAKIDETTKQFQDGTFEAKLQPTLKNECTTLAIGLLMYAIINLIIAACVKKKPPLVFPAVDEEPAV